MSELLGLTIGESSLSSVSFISNKMPKVAEYVTMEYDGKLILGMIDYLVRGSVSIGDDLLSQETVATIKSFESNDTYIRGLVSILGDIKDNLNIPRTPAPPGTEIRLASSDVLKDIFQVENGIRLGQLLSEDVEVKVNLNKMVSRHLAILAMTGAGKSNTVSVVVDGLLEYNGCVLIFDMHSEYVNTEFTNGKVNVIKPLINPKYMSFSEIKKLANIKENAVLQERIFRFAHTIAEKRIEKAETYTLDFLELLKEILNEFLSEKDDTVGNTSKDQKPVFDVLNKLDDMSMKYNHILSLNASNLLSNLELSSANVLDLGNVDESAAEVIVSHLLRNSLESRKKFIRGEDTSKLKFPVFFVVEEAHILAPKNRNPSSKYWISRIAREGRKFGLGLCLVSQSPKSLDPDSLSQANNMIILRLVEPQDQRHVQSASESLSEDLIKLLPSLNIGEAIVLGLMTKIPTLVKIDKFKGKTVGQDIDIADIWKDISEETENEIERQRKEFMELGGDY